MAALALTGPKELLLRLPTEPSVRMSILEHTADENQDGTWTVTVYAPEERIPAIEALGYAVLVVESDASLLARWQEIQVHEPDVS
jgi:hypothetical protein